MKVYMELVTVLGRIRYQGCFFFLYTCVYSHFRIVNNCLCLWKVIWKVSFVCSWSKKEKKVRVSIRATQSLTHSTLAQEAGASEKQLCLIMLTDGAGSLTPAPFPYVN